MEQKARRRGNAVRAAVTVATAAAMVGVLAPAAGADPLPGGLGPCLGSSCPPSWNDPNNGPVEYFDSNINVYVGGDFLVREAAAEAEGKVVTLGRFDMDKRDGVSQIYNVGIAGVGSRVPPPDGSDYLTAGGDVTIADGERLLAEEGTHSGRVAYAGDLTGTVNPTTAPRFDEDAAAPYTALRPQLTEASQCYAYDGDEHREATGTWVKTGDLMTFTGDGSSAIQIFDVDADLESEAGGNTGFVFNGIPEGATVLVNVYGSTRSVATFMGSFPNEGLRENLLWNFPDATDLSMSGPAQFEGSVLVGQPTSTTVLSMSGTNGRFLHGGFAHPHLVGRVGRPGDPRVPLRRRPADLHARPDAHADGPDAHADGPDADPDGPDAHADGSHAHADGPHADPDGPDAHADGSHAHADGPHAHADGPDADTDRPHPHADGPDADTDRPHPHAHGPDAEPHGSHPDAHGPDAEPHRAHAHPHRPHPDPDPDPAHPHAPTGHTPHPTHSPSHPGELPDTGSRGGEWIIGSIAAALVAAGGTVLVATRRARRRTF
ncbi:choice-of-anchor A domain-containing protein [Streptomyces sp. HB372]|nr:choice-of-anchor A domain-containing protein [Streptomyces sp. HB372]